MTVRVHSTILAAALALAACSEEAPPPAGGGNGGESVQSGAADAGEATPAAPPSPGMPTPAAPEPPSAPEPAIGTGGTGDGGTAMAGGAADAPAGDAAATGTAYEVDCPEGARAAEQCEVGKDIYVGWRTYASTCFQCHGGSGMGTSFGPNLMDRLNAGVDRERFDESVLNGYRGQMGMMPAWEGNTRVEKNLEPLWLYLKARADGALPAGRPKRKSG